MRPSVPTPLRDPRRWLARAPAAVVTAALAVALRELAAALEEAVATLPADAPDAVDSGAPGEAKVDALGMTVETPSMKAMAIVTVPGDFAAAGESAATVSVAGPVTGDRGLP
jgi:hypothetical protein